MRKQTIKENDPLVFLLEDLELTFRQKELEEITERYERGESIEDLAEEYSRDPDEVFIGIFHQARRGKIKRKFGIRLLC